MFALKDNWWKQIIDGECHHFGQYVFDHGLGSHSPEPGYLESCRKASEMIEGSLNTRVTLDFYKKLQRITTSHFASVDRKVVAMDSCKSGLFRKDYLVYAGTGSKTANVTTHFKDDISQLDRIGNSLLILINNPDQNIFSKVYDGNGEIEVEIKNHDKILTNLTNIPNSKIPTRIAQDLISYLSILIKWKELKFIDGKYTINKLNELNVIDEDDEFINLFDPNHSFYQQELSLVLHDIFQSFNGSKLILDPMRKSFHNKIELINSCITKYNSIPFMKAIIDGKSIRFNYIISNQTTKTIFDIFRKTNQTLETIVMNLFDDYYSSLKIGNNEINLRAVASLFQNLEWLHPFYDGQGRTDILLLNKLLLENNFTPVILEYPYYSSSNTLESWIEYLKEGMEKWQEELRNL